MKCESAKCEVEAVAYVAWPGRAVCMCDGCAVRARLVAAHMGFVLAVLPLTAELAVRSVVERG